MKYYNILCILFIFSSCDVSTLSNADTLSLADLKVNINICHDTKKNTLSYLKVKLSDGKKQIINKNIRVLLNSKPLDLYVKEELYYTKTSYYKADSFTQSDAYYFELILPDNSRHPLAFVKPMEKSQVAKFSIPDSIAANDDFVLKWENLNTPHQLELIKGTKTKHSLVKSIIEYDYAVKPLDTLRKNTGQYVVSKSHFTDSLSVAKHFDIILSRKESGLINPSLLKNSTITYHYMIQKTINSKEN